MPTTETPATYKTTNPALDKLDPTRRRAELLICGLAHQIPCMTYKPAYFRPGYFDAEKLERDSRVWSSGEIHCVNFLLGVWSGSSWTKDEEYGRPVDRTFDLFKAMGTLSLDNIVPMAEWMQNPFWP